MLTSCLDCIPGDESEPRQALPQPHLRTTQLHSTSKDPSGSRSANADANATSPSAQETPQTAPAEAGVEGSEEQIQRSLQQIDAVRQALQTVIRGKADVIDSVLNALLAEGSVLLEDVPGVGKTVLAKSIAGLLDLDFQRIQCTPDLLPADILGSSIFQPSSGTFEFRRGPVFCDLLIADEINRASPRTQSALLEAMAESQVTVDGTRYQLQQPFLVIATQNPSGFEGTYPLPESQLDRFLFRLSMNYPDPESEVELLLDPTIDEPDFRLDPIMRKDDLIALQQQVRRITVNPKIASYIVQLVNASRQDARLRMGCSPRGSKMLLRAAQARALMQGRQFVMPDDVQTLAVDVMTHRIALRNTGANSEDAKAIVRDLVDGTEVPV